MTPLVPHPTTPEAAFGVAAGVERTPDAGLRFTYRVVGGLDRVRLPPSCTPRRVDGLWEHTCFEAFVRVEGEGAYVEHNFAPSGAWARYAFTGYRTGAACAGEPPRLTIERGRDAFDLAAWVPVGRRAPLRVGLTAVVETTDGRRSYWALRHPPGAPDFHHEDGFAVRLA